MTLKLVLYLALLQVALAVSPYLVLELAESASQAEVQAQYKKLTRKLKNTEKGLKKRELYDAAYKEIVLDRILAGDDFMVEDQNIDEPLYGMEEGVEINQVDSQKLEDAKQNMRIAHYIMFIGSCLLKLSPCLLLFFCCRKNMQGQDRLPRRHRHGRQGLAQAR